VEFESPDPLPRALGLLPTIRWSRRMGLTLSRVGAIAITCVSIVVLAGRATRVPEGAVTSGYPADSPGHSEKAIGPGARL
jgi:hypothetical protein